MIVREFRIWQGCESDFELVFGPDGVWAGLLQPRSPGFLGTELEKVADSERCYRVRDYWKSHRDFEDFRSLYHDDLEQFHKWLVMKELVEHETLLAAFYSEDPGDDAGLVQA